jgi:hypothetical protein
MAVGKALDEPRGTLGADGGELCDEGLVPREGIIVFRFRIRATEADAAEVDALGDQVGAYVEHRPDEVGEHDGGCKIEEKFAQVCLTRRGVIEVPDLVAGFTTVDENDTVTWVIFQGLSQPERPCRDPGDTI